MRCTVLGIIACSLLTTAGSANIFSAIRSLFRSALGNSSNDGPNQYSTFAEELLLEELKISNSILVEKVHSLRTNLSRYKKLNSELTREVRTAGKQWSIEKGKIESRHKKELHDQSHEHEIAIATIKKNLTLEKEKAIQNLSESYQIEIKDLKSRLKNIKLENEAFQERIAMQAQELGEVNSKLISEEANSSTSAKVNIIATEI